MFDNSLEKAKAIVKAIKDDSTFKEPMLEIEIYDVYEICEAYISDNKNCKKLNKEIASLQNYVRLLEKENTKLKGSKNA